MKKIVFLAMLLLGVVNLAQADMLMSIKDSIVSASDSTESKIFYFSNSEIVKIIADSKSLNPQIKNLSIIKITDTVILKINDSTIFYFTPLKGQSCWSVLSKGINSKALILSSSLLNLTPKEDGAVSDATFLEKIDSILGGYSIFDSITIDSNLAEENIDTLLSFFPDSRRTENIGNIFFINKPKGPKEILRKDSVFQERDEDSSLPVSYNSYYYFDDDEESEIKMKDFIVPSAIVLLLVFAIRGCINDWKRNRPYKYKPEKEE